VLLRGIARCARLGGLVHPLFGVTQYLLGRTAGIIALSDLFGKRHSAACDMIFRYLGRQRLPGPVDRQPRAQRWPNIDAEIGADNRAWVPERPRLVGWPTWRGDAS
jgi:hypothetical protein